MASDTNQAEKRYDISDMWNLISEFFRTILNPLPLFISERRRVHFCIYFKCLLLFLIKTHFLPFKCGSLFSVSQPPANLWNEAGSLFLTCHLQLNSWHVQKKELCVMNFGKSKSVEVREIWGSRCDDYEEYNIFGFDAKQSGKIYRRFVEMYCLYLQDQRLSRANKQSLLCLQLAWFYVWKCK